MRHFKDSTPPALLQRQRGLTLFELVVYILVVAIIFAVAMNRFRGLPQEAERANFHATLMQIEAGINLQMMSAIAGGDWYNLRDLEGTNPMHLMLRPPSNYMGEFASLQYIDLPGHVWFFDTRRGELVYLAGNTDNLFAVVDGLPMSVRELRFRLSVVHGDYERRDWQGVMLEPVHPYRWEQLEIEVAGLRGS